MNVFYVFLMSLVTRLMYLGLTYTPESYRMLSDDKAYMELALNMVSHGPMVFNTTELSPTASVIGPGIGWLLMPVVSIFGQNWPAVFIYTAVISSFIPVFVYLIAKRIYDKRIAVLAAFWSILYILFLKYTLTAGKDLWMTLLLLTCTYLIVRQIEKEGHGIQIVMLSITYAMLIHLDERFLIIGPVFFAFLLFLRGKNLKAKLEKSFLFVGMVFVLMIPWLMRNYHVHDKIVLISLRTAKYTDKLFGYDQVENFPSHERRWYISTSDIEAIKDNNVTSTIENELDEQQVDAIKNGVLPHKFNYFETCLASFINFWEPIDISYGYYHTGYRFDGKWSLKHNLSVAIFYGVMLVFSILGFPLLFKKQKHLTLLILIVIVSYSFLHIFVIPFTTYRYRIPLDPYIIIAGCYGLVFFFNSLFTRFFKTGGKIKTNL